MTNHKTTNILGVSISNLPKNDLISTIKEKLNSDTQTHICTPNPEIVLNATQKDEELFFILNHSQYSIADGFGLKLTSLCNLVNLHRITGADLTTTILKIAEEQNQKVLIISWENSISSPNEIKQALKQKYPNLNFLIIPSDLKGSRINYNEIHHYQPSILFVNFGSPAQEKFIHHNLEKIKSIKIASGVGGSFDFLTNKMQRAPLPLRKIGLEWLWRLYQEPKRYKRIINATIVFPWKFFIWKFIKPFFYRPNVACILYKKENNSYKILLVKRKSQKEHWQLPQGGTDGENLKKAGIRELQEELNLSTDKIQLQKTFRNVHKYHFNGSISKYKVKSQLAVGYKGQKQGLIIAKFLGEDKDIKVNFYEHSNWKWVDSQELLNTVHECRKPGASKFIKKFNSLIDKNKI